MKEFGFFRANARWLVAGLLIALGSSFGQTFFIAVFAQPLRGEFNLSHGDFGAIYMAATLASAATLIQLGRAADLEAERWVLAAAMLALALACLSMSAVSGVWMLGLTIYGLRLCGQGMMGHLSQSFTARWFARNRGRALAIAALGFSLGEALAPRAAVALNAAVDWRWTWAAAALFLILALLPLLWLLLSRDRTPRGDRSAAEPATGLEGRHWSRAQALRHPAFWLLLPGLMGPSFILTSVFFLPAHIAEIKGWTLAQVTGSYGVYAAVGVASSLFYGGLIDRFGARVCLPIYQLPMALGLLALVWVDTHAGLLLVMALFGAGHGGASALLSALWAELYGVRHIGSIRAVAHAASVFASALGPGVVGALLDRGVGFELQAQWMAAYTLGVCGLFLGVTRLLSRREQAWITAQAAADPRL